MKFVIFGIFLLIVGLLQASPVQENFKRQDQNDTCKMCQDDLEELKESLQKDGGLVIVFQTVVYQICTLLSLPDLVCGAAEVVTRAIWNIVGDEIHPDRICKTLQLCKFHRKLGCLRCCQ